MRVLVEQVSIEEGSTIGFGIGRPEGATSVYILFAGDVRQMTALGNAMIDAGEPIPVDVPDWAIVDRLELPGR